MIKNNTKNRRWHVQLMLLEQILTRWQHPVASSKAFNLLHWVMLAIVTYRHTAMAIEKARKEGVFFHCCFVDCCPGGRQGNTDTDTEQA
jgi:hypothetical protein